MVLKVRGDLKSDEIRELSKGSQKGSSSEKRRISQQIRRLQERGIKIYFNLDQKELKLWKKYRNEFLEWLEQKN